jgi:hypothetical protein
MLIKRGDAEIIKVISPEEVADDKKRQEVLSSALEQSKKDSKDIKMEN